MLRVHTRCTQREGKKCSKSVGNFSFHIDKSRLQVSVIDFKLHLPKHELIMLHFNW
jgi:hypothetical protein